MIRLQVVVVCGLGLSAAACGTAAPAAPTASVAAASTALSIPSNVAGVWHGYITGTSCLSSNPCRQESLHPFTLRATPAGPGWTGSVEIQEGFDGRAVSIDVTGTAQPDGSVIFSGSRSPIFQKSVRINRLRVKTDPSAGLVGDFDLLDTKSISGQSSTLNGAVVSASYQPVDASSIAGAWEGVVTMRSCQAGCAYENVPGQDSEIDLLIGANGAASVTLGSVLFWFPFEGTVGAGTFAGASSLIQYAAESRQIEQFSVGVDSLGRISSGSFVVSGIRNSGGVLTPFRWTMEILWLVRP